jgi:NTP pyrophosphatase (non-canonical NTP hydrolase)
MNTDFGSGDFSIGSNVWPGTSKVIEEMGELGQVLGKLIAVAGDTKHWDGDLRKRLVEEIGDVVAALLFFQHNLTAAEGQQIAERAEKKLALFREWHANPTGPT